MGNAVEQALLMVERQREAMRDVNAFFAPYIEVEKRVQRLRPYHSEKGLQQDFHLDTDPDNEQEGGYSFRTEEFEEYSNEYRTEWMVISEELIADPAAYEKRKIEEHEAQQRRQAAEELGLAQRRLEAAQKNLTAAAKTVEEKQRLVTGE